MLKVLSLASVIVCVLTANTAKAGSIHGSTLVCRLAVGYVNDGGNGLLSASNDGCAVSNPFAIFRDGGFYAKALGSGQTWAITAAPWNIAGVHYPLGYDGRITLLDPTVQANLPAGCTVSGTGPYSVNCNVSGFSGTSISLGTPSTPSTPGTGFDFSLHGCVHLYLRTNNPKLLNMNIANSIFANGPNCSTVNGSLITAYSGVGSGYTLNITQSILDGCSVVDQFCPVSYPTQPFNAINDGRQGGFSYTYNVILNTSGRPISHNGQDGGVASGSTITSGVLTVGTLAGNIDQNLPISGGTLTQPCVVGTNIAGGSASGSTWNVVGSGCSNQPSETMTFSGPDIIKYNYTTGWTYPIATSAQHGELIEHITAANSVIPMIDYEYNTCLMQAYQAVANTACFDLSSGNAHNGTFTSVVNENNFIAINDAGGVSAVPGGQCHAIGGISGSTVTITAAGTCPLPVPIPLGALVQNTNIPSGQAQVSAIVTPWNGAIGVYTINIAATSNVAPGSSIAVELSINSAAMSEISYAHYGTIIIHNNYIDHTGGSSCFVNAAALSVGSTDWGSVGAGTANYSLTTGNVITGWSIPSGSPGCN